MEYLSPLLKNVEVTMRLWFDPVCNDPCCLCRAEDEGSLKQTRPRKLKYFLGLKRLDMKLEIKIKNVKTSSQLVIFVEIFLYFNLLGLLCSQYCV